MKLCDKCNEVFIPSDMDLCDQCFAHWIRNLLFFSALVCATFVTLAIAGAR